MAQPGMEPPEEYTRLLPEGWPLGDVEFTQGMVWGPPDILTARMNLRPKHYVENVEPVDIPPEVVEVKWDSSVKPARWSAYAVQPFQKGEPIGVFAGILRDDTEEFWTRLPAGRLQHTAPFEWLGRKLVVDASEYGNSIRFIGLTSESDDVNVHLGIGRCICGRSDPMAVLVAIASCDIRRGEKLIRQVHAEDIQAVQQALTADASDWSGWSLNLETGMTERTDPTSATEWVVPLREYIPIPFLDIKAKNPHALRDQMCMHKPTPRVRIWEIDDDRHVCYGARGLLATERIPAGQVIGRYTGFVTCTSEHDGEVRGTYTVDHAGFQAGQVIDGYVHGNEIRYDGDSLEGGSAVLAPHTGDACGQVHE